jgi:Fic family protein
VRLLTYSLLIKYGFKVKDSQLINPTAVFCNNREKYYQMLARADDGSSESYLNWCEYVLTGICEEISKVNKLLDHDYLFKSVLKPAIALSKERKVINNIEAAVLTMGLQKQRFKAADIHKVVANLTARQCTNLVAKMKINNLIVPIKQNARKYVVSFENKYLMRSLVQRLEEEKFIPAIDQ